MSSKKQDNYTKLEDLYETDSIPDTESETGKSDVISEYDYKVKQGNSFFNKTTINVILTILFLSLSIFGLNSEVYLNSDYKITIKVVSILVMSSVSFIINYFF